METNHKLVALLTDTLPAEVPIIYSNKTMFDYVKNNIVKWDSIKFVDGDINKKILKATVPYNFLVNKNDHEKRKIGLLHPLAQLQLTKFVEEFESLIINYFLHNSIFSIRYPKGVNNFVLKIPHKFISETNWILDSTNENYENISDEFIKNYFNLSRFPRITDFYKSYYLKHLELKYTFLTKLDFQQCFDSIYTHSIDWAYLGDKEVAKDNLDNTYERFSGLLDRITQTINYNETNGILVGPEFSRIIAEFVLTRIDNILYSNLLSMGIIFKRDYEIVRFIDDIFIFHNDQNIGDEIEKQIKIIGMDYKLSINQNKKTCETRPFLRSHLWVPKIKKELQVVFDNLINKRVETNSFYYDNFYQNIRVLIHEYNDHNKYIVSYAISSFERKVEKIIRNVETSKDSDMLYFHYAKLMDLLVFLLTYSLKSENVLKLCRIIIMLKKSAEKSNYDLDDLIFLKLFNILKYNENKFNDLLNLIVILTFNKNDLPSNYLVKILGGNKGYFPISVITFYIINKKDGKEYYSDVVREINKYIHEYILEIKTRFSLANKRNSDDSQYDEIDGVLTSEYFYLIHDIYSSGILNLQNEKELKKILKKISMSKTTKGMGMYNLFLDYVRDFDKPFMNWNADSNEIVKDIFIMKYKKVFSYD